MKVRGRFAPSTTGAAHPGTLLAALLAWLDARSKGGTFVLRYEDIDPQRCKVRWLDEMRDALDWLGIDWDEERKQSDSAAVHADALDRLAGSGLLYPCACSRSQLRAAGRRGPDGGWAYDNTCRSRRLPAGGWRASHEAVRVRLPPGIVQLADESGLDLSQDPSAVLGDPVVRRRDGAVAYNLAVVVDDADSHIDRIVRGRDIAASTATQVALQRVLGLATPTYRHHLLLMESHGQKLAKLHGSVGLSQLRPHYDAPALCGMLAWLAGLRGQPDPVTPRELVREFAWSRVAATDRLVRWNEGQLQAVMPP